MKKPSSPARRAFLSQLSGTAGVGWLATQWPLFLAAAEAASEQQARGEGFAALGPELAAALDAVTAQIIPSGETPGAREAGAIWFIDALVATSWGWAMPMLEAGVEELNRGSGPELNFADLPFDEQTAVLAEMESGQFFSILRMLTIAGTFALPALGGNRDKLGWQMIGFENRHVWLPPFGYYDAEWKQPSEIGGES